MRHFLITILASLVIAPASLRAADLRYPEDATLRAIQFVDSKEGWSVGDAGVIWHSIDGGQSWERQPSGVRASLRSLHFLSPYVGWVAGREEQPYGAGSVGVLLFTRDGGLTWQRQLANSLPGLNQVRFVDGKTGYVLGDGSDQFGSGVFRTTDGGNSWIPIQGPRSPGWRAGDFSDAKSGILAGAWSRLATLNGEQFSSGKVDALDGRSLLGLALLNKRAIAVGQGGLILTSESGGARWGFADLKLPVEILASLDFHAISSAGNNVWVVGRPGSFVLKSTDQGVHWALSKTGQRLPLHGLHFENDHDGWAVGDLGTVLATNDGGATWTVQRQGGKRAAALVVNARPEDVPLDTIASLGADDGYLVANLRVTAPDPASAKTNQASDPERFDAASRGAGAAAGEMLWQFPVPQHLMSADKSQLLGYWNQQFANQADREMLRQLVLALRMWKPDLVLIDSGKEGPRQNAGSMLSAEAMREAVKQAADPQSFPEQIDKLGLELWHARKLYSEADKKDGAVSQTSSEFRARLEANARDYAAEAFNLLTDKPGSLPGGRYYQLVESNIEGAAQQAHLMDGLSPVVGEARRKVPMNSGTNTELLQAFQARDSFVMLNDKLNDPNKMLAQIGPMLDRLPEDFAAAAAFGIANQYARQGQWPLAREAFLLMVDRYPSHPLAVDAYRWLIRYGSSGEARRRQELGQFKAVGNLAFGAVPVAPVSAPKSGQPVQQANYVEPIRSGKVTFLANQEETRQWYRGSLEIGKRLGGFGPLYASDPSIQFCLQASKRRLNDFKGAQDWYSAFQAHGPKGPWQTAAAGELWLLDRGQPQPNRLALCRLTTTKPHLDGLIDDACWKGIQPMVLENAVGQSQKDHGTEAFFAFDAEYLYIAVRCKHPQSEQMPIDKVRTRDADMAGHDRVSIMLDIDRDYSTYYRLEIDERGQVRDDCWGDSNWNPRWYVACQNNADGWTAEAAIPLIELTGEPIRIGDAWACNITRILPGKGVQAWSQPADVEPRPEGMSLLIFNQEAKRK